MRLSKIMHLYMCLTTRVCSCIVLSMNCILTLKSLRTNFLLEPVFSPSPKIPTENLYINTMIMMYSNK